MGAIQACCNLQKLPKGSKDLPIKGNGVDTQGIQFSHVFAMDNSGKIDSFYDVSKEKLGEESTGSVFKAIHKTTQIERAVKLVFGDVYQGKGDAPPEISLLRSMDHPNIQKLYEVFTDAKCVYLVLEMCSGGELLDGVMERSQGVRFTEHRAATFCEQMLGAITYIHANNIAHRDIRPESIMLQDKSNTTDIKIVDFGSAVKYKKGTPLTTKVGSPYYIAPEVLNGSYDYKCDVWSCGVVAYIMLCGSPPWQADNDSDLLKAVAVEDVTFPKPAWAQVSQAAKDMITSILIKNPVDRPEASSVLNESQWLKRGDVKGKQPLPSIVRRLQAFNQSRRLKQVCLTVIATQLQKKDIEELRQYFKSLDKNGDGTISRKELLQGLEQQAKSLPGMSPEALEKLVAIDSDGSGSIDYTEFLAAAIDKQVYQERDVMWNAFRTFDLDGNGKIEPHELKQIMESNNNVNLSDAKVKALVTEADKNGDGKIDFEEFMNMMKED